MEANQSQPTTKWKSLRNVIIIAVILGVYFYLTESKPHLSDPELHPAVAGQPAPDFALPGLDGQIVRLSDLRGKIVFLNIWATWCGPCRAEMPSMQKLYQQLKNDNFEMLAVSIDAQGASVVEPFLEKYKLTFPVLLDPTGRIGRLYNTTGIPETFIINEEGIIVLKVIGARDWTDAAAVETLENLSRKTPATTLPAQ